MDFLDPKKQRRHALLLYVGYVFIGIAILISTIILVYQANGFGVNNDGEVVQNGLVFMSTQPNPADITLNGTKNEAQTNTRLSLPAGDYSLKLSRAGYRDWSRDISVQGGVVQNYDYPFLFPAKPKTRVSNVLIAEPGVASQSRDRRWLLLQESENSINFNVYDLRDNEVETKKIVLPEGVVTATTEAQSWEALQWANDNEHALFKHTYGNNVEYIIVNRSDPAQSLNINQALTLNPAKLTLSDNKYDEYHVLIDGTLSTVSLNETTPVPILKNVLEYKTYGSDTVLYARPDASDSNMAAVALMENGRDYTVRRIARSDTYALDIARYQGNQYVVLGGAAENMVYVYKNVGTQLKSSGIVTAQAERALRVPTVRHVSFSPNTQYIAAQSGQLFGVYDIFLKRAHVFTADKTIDAPEKRVEWMDGSHLTYTGGNNQVVVDFDGRNSQTLMPARSMQGSFFSPDYRYMYSVGTTEASLTQTGTRTPADL